MKRSKFIQLPLVASLSLVSLGHAQLALNGSGVLAGVKNIRFPLGDHAARPEAVLTIGEIIHEKRRLGPLRLGVFQQVVFKLVDINLLDIAPSPHWPGSLGALLNLEPSIAMAQFHGFSISGPHGQKLLSAARASFSPERGSLLLENTTFTLPDGSQSSLRCEIPLEGPDAGKLILRHGDRTEKMTIVPEKQ